MNEEWEEMKNAECNEKPTDRTDWTNTD
jgi:hypothetical protein